MKNTAPDRESARELEIITALESDVLDIKQRRAHVSELNRIGTGLSVEILRQSLHSRDAKSSVGAVYALARIRTDEAVDALVESLSMELGPHLTHSAYLLGKIAARRAIPGLISCLEARSNELDAGDRRLVIEALMRMPHRSEVPVLAAALKDRNRRVRRAAARALAQIRAPESLTALESGAAELSWLNGLPVRRAMRMRERAGDE